MSTTVHESEFLIAPDIDEIADGMERAARDLRLNGKCDLYLGATVHAYIRTKADGDDAPSVWIDV